MKGFCPDTRAHGAQQTTELRRRARRAHTRLFIVPPARPRRPPRASPVAACGDTGGRGSGGRNHCLMIETHSNETTRTPGIGKRRSRPSWAERCPVPHWLQCATVCTRGTASGVGKEDRHRRRGRWAALVPALFWLPVARALVQRGQAPWRGSTSRAPAPPEPPRPSTGGALPRRGTLVGGTVVALGAPLAIHGPLVVEIAASPCAALPRRGGHV